MSVSQTLSIQPSDLPPANAPALIQADLYFDQAGSTPVTDRAFRQFLNTEITSRFPNGLTLHNATGQTDQKAVSLVFENIPENQAALTALVPAYQQKFQATARQVVNEDLAIGFGTGEDLIQNDPTPELIQVDLYFGRNIGTTGRVTEQQFQQFLNDQIIPQFADDLTVYDARGQFMDSSDQLIREPSKVVSLITTDTEQNEQSINGIISAYKQQFQQESVLQVVDETLSADFGITLSSSGPLYSLFAAGR